MSHKLHLSFPYAFQEWLFLMRSSCQVTIVIRVLALQHGGPGSISMTWFFFFSFFTSMVPGLTQVHKNFLNIWVRKEKEVWLEVNWLLDLSMPWPKTCESLIQHYGRVCEETTFFLYLIKNITDVYCLMFFLIYASTVSDKTFKNLWRV